MKCPHCGKEHPDDFKVCPYTAKPIEPQFQHCKNGGCNFRSPLPLSAKFCPNCGTQLQTSPPEITKSIPFCCVEETISFGWNDDRSKYKFYNDSGILLSEKEFHIVDYTLFENNAYSDSGCLNQLLLFEPIDKELFYLDSKGVLYKLNRYSDCSGFRVGKSWDDKWHYEAKIIDKQHILYRNRYDYFLYEINDKGIPVLKKKFSTKLLPNINDYHAHLMLIGDYICTTQISIRVNDGCPETIPGYTICRCIGYKDNEPIFAASEVDDWDEDGCDIVNLKGVILWHCHCSTIDVIYEGIIQIDDINSSELYTIDGEYLTEVESFAAYPINKDILRIGEWNYYSISRKKKYIDYEMHGEYYKLTEKLSDNEVLIQIFTIDNKIVYSLKADPDEFEACDFLDIYNDHDYFKLHSHTPLVKTYRGDIVNLTSGKVIYHLNDNEWCIGTSMSKSRFAVQNWPYYKVIDLDGNIIHRFKTEDYNYEMCTNGYLVSSPIKKSRSCWKIKYYDSEFNSDIIEFQRPSSEPKSCDCIQMSNNDFIIMLSMDYHIILSLDGEFICKNDTCKCLFNNIYVGHTDIVNLEKNIVIKNCSGIII